MRELDPLAQDKKLDSIEIVAEQQQKKEIKLVASQRKIRGLICWEFNEKTRELKPAEYRKVDFMLTSFDPNAVNLDMSYKVDVKEDCTYFQALNRKNAIKHLKKMGYE